MSNIKWKIEHIDLRSAGVGDSVELVHFQINLSDSNGNGIIEQETIDWVPRDAIYYADSSTARSVAQSSAFDNWLEIDSEHTDWMKRVQWNLKSRLWNKTRNAFDSDGFRDTSIKTVLLNDSAEVVNPLGL